MVELAFKVAEGTAFYKQFFRAHKEKQKFHDLARAFFEKHDLMDGPCQYYQCRALGIEMDDAQKMRFSSQIRKGSDIVCQAARLSRQMCYARFTSTMTVNNASPVRDW